MHEKHGKQHGWGLIVITAFCFMLLIVGSICAVLATLITRGAVGEGSGELFLYFAQFISVLAGAELTKKVSGTVNIRLPMIVTVIYIMTILTTGLLIKDDLENIWLHLGAIGFGYAVSSILSLYRSKGNRRRKRPVW